jgi:hypothetical protein
VDGPDIDILIDQVPAMMLGIIREVVAQCPRARVVAENVPAAEIAAAVERHRPDVVILGNARALGEPADVAYLLGPPSPPWRIVTLFDQDRHAHLHRWERSVTVVDRPSSATLRAAILGEAGNG